VIEIDRIKSAYRLRLADTATGLEWLSMDEEGAMILSEEPDSTPWQRAKLWLLKPWIPESLL